VTFDIEQDMRHLSSKVVLVVAATAAAVMAAQTPAQKPSFEVASVKPSDPNQRGASVQNLLGGRFVARGAPLRPLMAYAYRVQNFQILGGPGWVVTDRWDIEARAEEGSITSLTGLADPNVPDPMAIRLQSLFEDRFQLKIHRETRELPVYELAVMKSGLKMKLSEDQTPFRLPEPGTAPVPRPQQTGSVARYNMRIGRGSIEASAVEVASFVQALSQQAGRTIIDKTGLNGLYDIKLQWMPDTPPPNNSAATGGPEAAPIDQNGPSMFTAIEEQLGLRLESAKGPVDVIVIDSVQKPSEN
jgi:uncharacterized protein (TIGR03435 family)